MLRCQLAEVFLQEGIMLFQCCYYTIAESVIILKTEVSTDTDIGSKINILCHRQGFTAL